MLFELLFEEVIRLLKLTKSYFFETCSQVRNELWFSSRSKISYLLEGSRNKKGFMANNYFLCEEVVRSAREPKV